MRFAPVTNNDNQAHLRSLPVLAIDLGFSATKETCGAAAWPTDQDFQAPLNYSRFLESTCRWISKNDPAVVLILEAPLSGAFDPDGNPIPRGDFERFHSETNRSSPRHWNIMAGASMALAAIHFCHALGLRIKQEITIHVVEGFASRYTDEQHNKPSHMDVAKELLSRWRDGQELLIPQVVGSIVSVTGILSGDSSHGVSGILRVPDGLKSTAL
ncbi:hypothetical protein [Prosthecobacter sp.]|jgi:hypothetical protein|uniref:hypothetical protein n=1 Tax=Prosthecobacter sp. TaxID=1965333 RepID=UPI0037CA7432